MLFYERSEKEIALYIKNNLETGIKSLKSNPEWENGRL